MSLRKRRRKSGGGKGNTVSVNRFFSGRGGELSDAQFEFIKAMDAYKTAKRRPFPTWSEVLDVVESLGYRKVEASAGPI